MKQLLTLLSFSSTKVAKIDVPPLPQEDQSSKFRQGFLKISAVCSGMLGKKLLLMEITYHQHFSLVALPIAWWISVSLLEV